jgi:hypothetical protein
MHGTSQLIVEPDANASFAASLQKAEGAPPLATTRVASRPSVSRSPQAWDADLIGASDCLGDLQYDLVTAGDVKRALRTPDQASFVEPPHSPDGYILAVQK